MKKTLAMYSKNCY